MKNLAQINMGDYLDTPFGKSGGSNIGDLVSLILKLSFVASGIIVLILFIIGGISIISGSGTQNPEKAQKGSKTITNAVVGFAIIFVAYWIVRLLEVIIGIPFITQPSF